MLFTFQQLLQSIRCGNLKLGVAYLSAEALLVAPHVSADDKLTARWDDPRNKTDKLKSCSCGISRPADEFLTSEEVVGARWDPTGRKRRDSEKRPSEICLGLVLCETLVQTHSLSFYTCLGCRSRRQLPLGKGLLPVRFHSKGTKAHPSVRTRATATVFVYAALPCITVKRLFQFPCSSSSST